MFDHANSLVPVLGVLPPVCGTKRGLLERGAVITQLIGCGNVFEILRYLEIFLFLPFFLRISFLRGVSTLNYIHRVMVIFGKRS